MAGLRRAKVRMAPRGIKDPVDRNWRAAESNGDLPIEPVSLEPCVVPRSLAGSGPEGDYGLPGITHDSCRNQVSAGRSFRCRSARTCSR